MSKRPAAPCKARSKRTGQPCRSYANVGSTVCRMHGGASPQAKRKAEQRKALASWQRTFGTPIDGDDPSAVMLSEIAWSRGHVEWLRQQVAAEGLRWERLYGEWSDRLSRQLYLAHRAGVEERSVAVVQELGAAVTDLIRRVLLDVPDASTRAVVRASFSRHLVALVGDAGGRPALMSGPVS